jgi:hypothetical protein
VVFLSDRRIALKEESIQMLNFLHFNLVILRADPPKNDRKLLYKFGQSYYKNAKIG